MHGGNRHWRAGWSSWLKKIFPEEEGALNLVEGEGLEEGAGGGER